MENKFLCEGCGLTFVSVKKEEAKALLSWLEREFIPHDERYLILQAFVHRLREFVEQE